MTNPDRSSTDAFANWGENRDEYPVRDMRYRCRRCGHMKAYSSGGLCSDCPAAPDEENDPDPFDEPFRREDAPREKLGPPPFDPARMTVAPDEERQS